MRSRPAGSRAPGHALHRRHAHRGRSSRYSNRRPARPLRVAIDRPPLTRRPDRITGLNPRACHSASSRTYPTRQTCPVTALATWLPEPHCARPVVCRFTRDSSSPRTLGPWPMNLRAPGRGPVEYERSRWGNSSPSPIPRASGYAAPDRMRRIADAGTGAGFREPRSSRSAAPRPSSASRPSLTPPLKISEGDPMLEQHLEGTETSNYHI